MEIGINKFVSQSLSLLNNDPLLELDTLLIKRKSAGIGISQKKGGKPKLSK